MSTQTSVGKSVAYRAFPAGQEAAGDAVDALNAPPHLVLVFGTTGYDQDQLLAGVRAEVGAARVVGCSGEGVIAGDESIERERAVSVMAIRSDLIYFDVFMLTNYAAEPAACGRELGERVGQLDDAIGVWLLADGLHGDCTSFLAALQASLGRPVPIVGGTAADAFRLVATYQYLDDVVTSDAVCAIVLRGLGRMEVAVSHGCLPVGRPRVVTRAENGWVYEVDGRPAWSVLREYLDGEPQDLTAEGIVQLCVGERLDPQLAAGYPRYVIRTPFRLDQQAGALFFPGGSPRSGQEIQLTRRDPRQIEEGALACAADIAARHEGERPALVVQFDCAGRGAILFGADAAKHIVHPLQQSLGRSTPWIGLHTYGEIAPIGDTVYFHNYTVALCAVYDELTTTR